MEKVRGRRASNDGVLCPALLVRCPTPQDGVERADGWRSDMHLRHDAR
jgi:hypothetical protein